MWSEKVNSSFNVCNQNLVIHIIPVEFVNDLFPFLVYNNSLMFLLLKGVIFIMKHDNTHLTLNDRKIIQTGIENRSTKAAIAKNLGKDV